MVDRSSLAVAAVGLVLATGLVGGAYVSGVADPIPDGAPETAAPTSPAATVADGGDERTPDGGTSDGGSEGGGDATRTPPASDLQFLIANTESCGSTCRNVTVRLTNGGTETATGVSAESRIFVEDDRIWTGTEDIGTVEAGESVTRTKRVELGVTDAAKVRQNGGYVTVETEVTWDGGRETFTQRVETA